jgi:hypothetical protein
MRSALFVSFFVAVAPEVELLRASSRRRLAISVAPPAKGGFPGSEPVERSAGLFEETAERRRL